MSLETFWTSRIELGDVSFTPLSILPGFILLLIAIISFPVGVHYESDVFHVKEVLGKAVLGHPGVLKNPPPSAKFVEFGDSSLNFETWVWTVEWTLRPAAFKSEINYLLWKYLKEAGIAIPYPQRDLYIKEWRSPAMDLPDKPAAEL